MNPRILAQGDVLLREYIGPMPENPTIEAVDPRHGVVLAYGEATGSAHALDPRGVRVLEPTATTPRLLQIDAADVLGAAEAILRHVKHPPQNLPAKTVWEVVQQVEQIEGEVIRVAD